MADSHSRQPNPLRPYYIPPTIGKETAPIPNATTANATATAARRTASSSTFAFPDLDYSDYIPEASPSVSSSIKNLLDQALWKYTSVAIAQPFEVAKLILQTRVAQDSDVDEAFRGQDSQRTGQSSYYDQANEDDDDEPNYFTSSAPWEHTPTPTSRSPMRGRPGRPSRQSSQRQSDPPLTPSADAPLQIKNPTSLLDTLSALATSSGTLSIWRGTNSTFIYTTLHNLLETFLRSFLAALLGLSESEIALAALPSPLSLSTSSTAILGTSSPAITVLISTIAASLSALLLAPIDTARTRLILTPASQPPRSLLATIRTLSPSWLCPPHLMPITLLSSSLPTLISTTTPLFLKSQLGLDPNINPASWSISTFIASTFDLAVKYPLETVLRRAQISTFTDPKNPSSKRKVVKTIVPVPQTYKGILPTMWGIMRDEGYSESQKDRTNALMGKAPRRKRRGQGIEGLYRGWRVGLWGLVGVWGAGFVGGLQGGDESPGLPNGGKF